MAKDIVAVVLDHLRSVGRDKMILAPALQASLQTKLELFFSARVLDRAEVMRLLKLISVLDEREGTRDAADELTELIRRLPAAVAYLSAMRGRPVEAPASAKRLMEFETRRTQLTAPHVERRHSSTDLKLSDLRRPEDPQRLRAWSSSRGQPNRS